MKIAPLLAVLSLGSLVAACDSLDNPFHALLNTGNDARVYNGNTGSYEWPNSTPRPKPPAPPVVIASANKATPTPTATPGKKVAGRSSDSQKAAFVQGKNPSPTPVNAKATPSAVAVQATPVPPPAKGTGIYNMETGKFEWSPSGVPTARKPAAPPAQETQATPAPSVPVAPGSPLFPQ
jgi:hypothetical protein